MMEMKSSVCVIDNDVMFTLVLYNYKQVLLDVLFANRYTGNTRNQ